jgi:enamine deaminase RidA (YjgF/YER057c/UK114 family)
MTIELMNPAGLVDPQIYSQVAVATGSRMIFVAGQVGQDATGRPVEGLAAQAEQALANVGVALAAAGASFAEVARTTIYVVGLRPELMGELMAGLGAGSARLGIGTPGPTTLIGVSSLAAPDLLVEIEVTAVA